MQRILQIKPSIRLVFWVSLKNLKKMSKKGSKLESSWTVPFRIKEVLIKGTFRLCNVNDSEKILTSLYMIRLVVFFLYTKMTVVMHQVFEFESFK